MVVLVVVVHGVASQCDGFVPKIPKLALFHSCICWWSAFLPFLFHALVQPVEHFIVFYNVFLSMSFQLLMFDSECCLILLYHHVCQCAPTETHSKIMGLQIHRLFVTTGRNILSKIIIQKPTYNHFTAVVWNSWWKTPFSQQIWPVWEFWDCLLCVSWLCFVSAHKSTNVLFSTNGSLITRTTQECTLQ